MFSSDSADLQAGQGDLVPPSGGPSSLRPRVQTAATEPAAEGLSQSARQAAASGLPSHPAPNAEQPHKHTRTASPSQQSFQATTASPNSRELAIVAVEGDDSDHDASQEDRPRKRRKAGVISSPADLDY